MLGPTQESNVKRSEALGSSRAPRASFALTTINDSNLQAKGKAPRIHLTISSDLKFVRGFSLVANTCLDIRLSSERQSARRVQRAGPKRDPPYCHLLQTIDRMPKPSRTIIRNFCSQTTSDCIHIRQRGTPACQSVGPSMRMNKSEPM